MPREKQSFRLATRATSLYTREAIKEKMNAGERFARFEGSRAAEIV